jgi:hypothetical protein
VIKHIVVWKLKETAHGHDKMKNARMIKEKLESLNGKIDGLLKMEVGIDYSHTENSSDVVLYSEFVSKKDLENYQSHPEHKAIMPFVSEVRSERRMVDYEA